MLQPLKYKFFDYIFCRYGISYRYLYTDIQHIACEF